MSRQIEMTRVDPASIERGEPVPYAIFTADGALLVKAGGRILESDKLNVLRRQGWRLCAPGETPGLLLDVRGGPVSAPDDELDEDPEVQLRAGEPVPLKRTTALVADDMPLARILLTRILMDQGVNRVISAEDGRQAINRFFVEGPNLVFLDIDMPSLDGLRALRQIKSWSRGAFVCLVSASSTRVNVQLAQKYRVDGFLVKPYSTLNMQRILAKYQAGQTPSPDS